MRDAKSRFWGGWVRARLQKGSCEQLLRCASAADITLWNVLPQSGGALFSVCSADYLRLCRMRRESGLRFRLLRRHGFPLWCKRMGISACLVAGLAVMVLELWLLGGTVFVTEFYGQAAATPYEMQQVLLQCGAAPFVWQGNLEASMLSEALLASDSGISWASVNFRYGRAEAEVRAALPPPQQYSDAAYLVASQPCQLTRLELTSGQALAKQGDVLLAGDVIVQRGTGMKQGAWAAAVQARAWGYVQHKEVVRIEKYQVMCSATGRQCVRRRLLFGTPQPQGAAAVPPYRYYDVQQSVRAVQLFGVPLPVYLHTSVYSEVNQSGSYISPQQADRLFEQQLHAVETERLSHSRIVQKQLSCVDAGDAFVYTVQYLLECEVGQYSYD